MRQLLSHHVTPNNGLGVDKKLSFGRLATNGNMPYMANAMTLESIQKQLCTEIETLLSLKAGSMTPDTDLPALRNPFARFRLPVAGHRAGIRRQSYAEGIEDRGYQVTAQSGCGGSSGASGLKVCLFHTSAIADISRE